MTSSDSDDRFGLQGVPEVQAARRIKLGSALKVYAVMLGLRAFSALLFLPQGPGRWVAQALPSELGWAGFVVSALQLPVLLWGFWGVLSRRATGEQKQVWATLAFTLSVLFDIGSRTVSDIAQGRAIDGLSALLSALLLMLLGWILVKGRRATTWGHSRLR